MLGFNAIKLIFFRLCQPSDATVIPSVDHTVAEHKVVIVLCGVINFLFVLHKVMNMNKSYNQSINSNKV